jgi:pre-mRNA-splicing factor 18
VTVFGEDDAARVARFKELLRAGVLLDDSDDEEELMKGQRNDFLKDIAQMRKKEKHGVGVDKKKVLEKGGKDGVASGAEGASGGEGASEPDGGKDAKLMKADWEQLSDEERILVYFKRLLREWGQEVEHMPEKELRTSKGRSLIATQNQCQRYLEPMFRLCRKKRLPADVRSSLIKMINYCRERDYRLASDAYVKLAIGNAPWPIGATSIGIHDRSAREKIHATKIAHVMNDETTRKYLQSVKRLMTFAQRKYPTDPSKSLEFNSLANGSDLEALKVDRGQVVQQQQQSGLARIEAGPQPVTG